MNNPVTIEGGCRCGETRYRATGRPYKSSYCHCDDCRSATGALIQAWLMYDGGRIEFIKGSPKKYTSSPGVLRGFCPHCGTPLWWESQWHEIAIQMVPIGTLDNPETYPPDRHAFCCEKINWLEVADDLPRYSRSSPPPDQ